MSRKGDKSQMDNYLVLHINDVLELQEFINKMDRQGEDLVAFTPLYMMLKHNIKSIKLQEITLGESQDISLGDLILEPADYLLVFKRKPYRP
jgi:hypothetical protein